MIALSVAFGVKKGMNERNIRLLSEGEFRTVGWPTRILIGVFFLNFVVVSRWAWPTVCVVRNY